MSEPVRTALENLLYVLAPVFTAGARMVEVDDLLAKRIQEAKEALK